MKYVQVAILIVLIAVGVLLFMVWRGQHAQQIPVAQTAGQPVTGPAPTTAPEPSPQPVASEKPTASVQSSGHWKPATKRPTKQEVTQAHPGTVTQTQETPLPAPTTPPMASAQTSSSTGEQKQPPLTPEPPSRPRTVTLDAGSLISVRLNETLSTDKLKPGDTFTATLDRPLVVNNLVIAERGARVQGRVIEVQQAGRVKGVAELAIHLVQIHTSDGQDVAIQTDAFHKAGPTSTKQDAAKIGAGAAVGAIIGAIAGGGKGAGVGAAAGGAAGTGTVLATRGKPAVLPAETRIDFRLSAPVTITERTN